jgi:ACS family tartrate transporter-like MFS transporter
MAAALLMLDGKGGLHGWQHLFLIEGVLTVVFGVALKVRSTPVRA